MYIGSVDGVEKKMVEGFGIDYKGVPCGKLRRYFSLENFSDLIRVPKGFFQAKKELKKFSPDVVFSKGGFVAVPVVLAAAKLKIPVIIHESDVVPGLANKISARFAEKICVSFEESRKHFEKFSEKVVVTGNPVREGVGAGSKERGLGFVELNGDKPVVLVMGGSQGAAQINELIRGCADELLKKFDIVHLCGVGKTNDSLKKEGYVQFEYLDKEMADVYELADLVVSRGGANSLAEIAFLGKKALIIPLGEEASRGDQIKNAEVFAKKCGWKILDSSTGKDEFLKGVEEAYNLAVKKCEDLTGGAEKIAKVILNH